MIKATGDKIRPKDERIIIIIAPNLKNLDKICEKKTNNNDRYLTHSPKFNIAKMLTLYSISLLIRNVFTLRFPMEIIKD